MNINFVYPWKMVGRYEDDYEGMTDEEEISDYITDETGFCHCGFELVE